MPSSDVSIGLREIVCHFDELEDPRSTINRLHLLPSVLTISLMGVLAGAKGPTGIAKWAVAKKRTAATGTGSVEWDSIARRYSESLISREG